MKIALGQMEVKAGMPDRNLETMLKMVDEAKKQDVDLIAFPEMCIGGYLVGDNWNSRWHNRDLTLYNENLRDASDGIAIAYGNVFQDETKTNETGLPLTYNAVMIFQNGKPAMRLKPVPVLPDGTQPKALLPNYKFFDDKRYFTSLMQVAQRVGLPLENLVQPYLIQTKHDGVVPVGFETCEDIWNTGDYIENGQLINVTKMLVDNGAEEIVNLSASPWTYGKNGARDNRVKFNFKDIDPQKYKGGFHYVNITGVQNNGKNAITFDGGTTVYNHLGEPIKFAKKAYEEELIITDTAKENTLPVIERVKKDRIAEKYDAIVHGIRHMKDIFGSKEHPRFLLGLSGGIDSAVSAALVTKAVGSQNVLAVNMPTVYNSTKTKGAAKHVADMLGIRYGIVPIQELVEQQEKLLENADLDGLNRPLTILHKENIQAKIRGTSLLSNLAAKYGAIFTNNGNKLETALGYATLYGDINGAIAPLMDLMKTEVFDMARYINARAGKEIIPEIMIPNELYQFTDDQVAPSAELKGAQKDPMKFGYHDAILQQYMNYMRKDPEDILTWYKEGNLMENLGISPKFLDIYGLRDPKVFLEDFDWFNRLIDLSVFKRIQGPMGIVTDQCAWGYDRRESQLPIFPRRTYLALKNDVLQMKQYKEAA